jgi:alanine-synthesizing transaminase
MFSHRTAVSREPNALTVALDRARLSGRPLLDLTVSNPTRAGLPYPEARILSSLSDPRSLTYSPTPFGLASAREAVVRVYADDGIAIDPSRIVLTASTSEAYAFLFKLLCDDGDEVLIPAPSYPLFELLARFENVKLSPYALAYDGEWHVDIASVRAAITPRARAILIVSPNNPTGSYVKQAELEALAATGLPIVSDEVFAPFVLKSDHAASRRAKSVLGAGAGELVFALNGLSKMAALPQMKLGWIGVAGTNGAKVNEALERLELLADAFLSVGTPVQHAASELLLERHVTSDAIHTRLLANVETLRRSVTGTAATLLDVEGGWYATLRLPRVETEEAWTLLFLEEDGVYVHPGHFFDFAEEAYVVLSLLTPEGAFSEGVSRLVKRVETRVAAPRSTSSST